jgi:hypothetical protein
MDVAEARVVLGVGAGAGDEELRAAYRHALRRAHPDLHDGSDLGTTRVVDAYRVLVDAPPDPVDAPPPVLVDAGPVVVDGDTVAAELPAGDLFAMLHEVGHRIGEVAYVDPSAGLLEIVVELAGYGACSVVLTLQGRGTGTTEAFCTVEPLGGGVAPPASAVAELLADGLRTLV